MIIQDVKKPKLVKDLNCLKVDNLSSFYKRKKILNDISIHVKQGEIVGLLGPNGAGKTTCFQCIAGLQAIEHGNISLNNINITSLPIFKRARLGLNYLPQETSIFRGLSVEQNISSIIQINRSNEERTDNEFLDELLNEFSLDHIRNASAVTLSGGQKRRVEIARALASKPKFMLLDEPLAGIDPIALIDIKNIIYKLKEKNIGILITDHNVRETLQTVDRSYILHDGKIIASGSSEKLLEDTHVRRVYLGEKFKL
ncbi:MAG: LPS export ABC transporter ATP-binding protein [SAR116 cluster bacterium]|nr:LPS export ABC transporter ATP-binding protein [SAR116 cluster bacterium]